MAVDTHMDLALRDRGALAAGYFHGKEIITYTGAFKGRKRWTGK